MMKMWRAMETYRINHKIVIFKYDLVEDMMNKCYRIYCLSCILYTPIIASCLKLCRESYHFSVFYMASCSIFIMSN